MTLTFAETHNMISYLSKSNASEGFNQIIDFLTGSSVKYALTVNPNIYVSCNKQFWTSVAVKKVNDVMRLQALVDKKKVVILEATFRDALRLDDAEGIKCVPNEEIFAELARMDYEKPSTKLTFYKAFFSSGWKFLIHTILQCMSAKRTSWNEFSSSMAFAIICLSTGRKFNFSKYIFDSLVRNVDSPTKFYMYPHFLQLMIRKQVGDLSSHTTKYSSPSLTQKVFENTRRVGKGFFGIETPLFEGMIAEHQVDEVHDEGVPAVGVVAEGVVSAADAEVPTAIEELSILSPTPPTLPPQPSQDQPSTSQGRIITDMDADIDVILEDAKVVVEKSTDVDESADFKGGKQITVASAIITAAAPTLTDAAPPLTTARSAARKKKGVVIRDPQETATPSTIIHYEAYDRELEAELNKNIDWDEVIDHVQRKQKEDNVVKRYQALKRKPHTQAQARKNMMIYLRNVASFKMAYFKGITYDDIRLIFEKYFDSNVAFLQKAKEQMDEEDSRALKRLNESQENKAAKKQKLDEEVEELKRYLQIVPNDEDDVYT
nr:hypothetical protein [Tanacetum cinerariifolium]